MRGTPRNHISAVLFPSRIHSENSSAGIIQKISSRRGGGAWGVPSKIRKNNVEEAEDREERELGEEAVEPAHAHDPAACLQYPSRARTISPTRPMLNRTNRMAQPGLGPGATE